jgi:Pyruvate/2-oxoacid:ferredoxin oxidoreductase delta subunit
MHMKAPTSREFSDFLLDLYGVLLNGLPNRPRFIHLMDAVTALEGEGPGPAGTPKHVGAILCSPDALALDLAAVRTAGLDERKVLTLELGYGRGLGLASRDDLRIAGDYSPPPGFTGLQPAKSSMLERAGQWPRAFRALKNLLVEKPVPKPGPCTLCYQCRLICPAGAITVSDGRRKVPVYDYGLCIRCFCCSEVCPEAAIEKKRGSFQWILGR